MTTGRLLPFLLINDPGISKVAIIALLQERNLRQQPAGDGQVSLLRPEKRLRGLDICIPSKHLQVVWEALQLHITYTWNVAVNYVVTQQLHNDYLLTK